MQSCRNVRKRNTCNSDEGELTTVAASLNTIVRVRFGPNIHSTENKASQIAVQILFQLRYMGRMNSVSTTNNSRPVLCKAPRSYSVAWSSVAWHICGNRIAPVVGQFGL